jgi:hypothetical protein
MIFVETNMGNKLYKIALGFIMGALLLSILWPYEQKLIDFELPPTYQVLESDEIYFNNTRIVQYRTTESDALNTQGFKVHRSTKALSDTTVPFINFAIINHWRNDKAYIVCEPSARKFFIDPVTINVGDTSIVLDLDHMDYNDHYALAGELFKRSLNYERPFIASGQDSTFLFGTQPNAKANLVVLKDYFRLIGRFQ